MNNIKRIIDNANSMVKVEYIGGGVGFVHIDATTEEQRKAFILERRQEIKDYEVRTYPTVGGS